MLGENNKLYVTAKGVFFFQKQDPLSREYSLFPVEKDKIADLLAGKNPDAYIEFFGEVEEA